MNTTLLHDRPAAHLRPAHLLNLYRAVLTSRRFDERAWLLHRQGKIAFHASAMGHEAAQVGAVFAIRRGIDYICPYYRDLAMMIAVGWTPRELMLDVYAKRTSPSSAGRQMPNHFSDRRLGVVSTSAPVAVQLLHAAGMAFAIRYKARFSQDFGAPTDDSPGLALASLGEGSTSQGDFHEALNWAGVHKLPFICLVENNLYAISVRQEAQMAIADVSARAAGYGIHGVSVDGMDALAVYDVVYEAAQRAYRGEGATLIEAKVYRMTPHSSDDDDRSYRSREEVEYWRARDPVLRLRATLMEMGVLTAALDAELEAQVKRDVDEAQAFAEAAPDPTIDDLNAAVYAPGEVDAWRS